jgi:hypothetical protein
MKAFSCLSRGRKCRHGLFYYKSGDRFPPREIPGDIGKGLFALKDVKQSAAYRVDDMLRELSGI